MILTLQSETAVKLQGITLPDLTAFEANLIQPTELFVPKPEAAAEQFGIEPSSYALEYAGLWRTHLLEKRGAQRYYRDGDIQKCCPFAPTRLNRDTLKNLFSDSDWHAIWEGLQAGQDRDFLEQYEQLIDTHLSHWAIREKIAARAKQEADYRLAVAAHLLRGDHPEY